MDASKLAEDLIGIMKAAAPFVGMAEEVAAAEALYHSIEAAADTIKDALDSDDQATLQAGLDAFAEGVNAHADRTASSLGD